MKRHTPSPQGGWKSGDLAAKREYLPCLADLTAEKSPSPLQGEAKAGGMPALPHRTSSIHDCPECREGAPGPVGAAAG